MNDEPEVFAWRVALDIVDNPGVFLRFLDEEYSAYDDMSEAEALKVREMTLRMIAHLVWRRPTDG